jgi:hypothetical protein
MTWPCTHGAGLWDGCRLVEPCLIRSKRSSASEQCGLFLFSLKSRRLFCGRAWGRARGIQGAHSFVDHSSLALWVRVPGSRAAPHLSTRLRLFIPRGGFNFYAPIARFGREATEPVRCIDFVGPTWLTPNKAESRENRCAIGVEGTSIVRGPFSGGRADRTVTAMNECLLLKLSDDAMKPGGGKRFAGDCSRRRRFCFVENPPKAAWYARFRCQRLARRMLGS